MIMEIFIIIILFNFLFMPFVVAYGFVDIFSGYWNEKFISCALKIKEKLNKITKIKENTFTIYIVSINLLVATLVYLLDDKYRHIALIILPVILTLYLIAFSINYTKDINLNKIILEFIATLFTAIIITMIYDGFDVIFALMLLILLIMISSLSKKLRGEFN